MMLKIKKKSHLIIIFIILCVALMFLKKKEVKFLDYKQIQINKKPEFVKLFEISKEPLPSNVYEPINCVDSSKFIVTTKLCVHSKEKDVYISGSILGGGIWEGHLMGEY